MSKQNQLFHMHVLFQFKYALVEKHVFFNLFLLINIVGKMSFSTQIVGILTSFNYISWQRQVEKTCFSTSDGLFSLPLLFRIFITNEMKRLGNAHIFGCITTKIPTWDYHQLVIYGLSRVDVIVVGGGNGGWPPNQI